MKTPRALPIVLLLGVVGCAGADGGADDTAKSFGAVSMSGPDAQLVLDLVNYPGTSQALLDEEVGLDRRAAENIVAHRDGADGVAPNADDDLFDDLAELDAISYVGDSAFAKLHAWASAHPVAQAEHVEGVDFSGWQAEAVVWGVNLARVDELDVVVALDARAAENLVLDAPYGSVADMGPVGYVGQSALERMRAHAVSWWAAMHGASEAGLGGTFDGVPFDDATAEVAVDIVNVASQELLVASGMWSQGASTIVGSRPYDDLAQVAAVSGVGTATMQALHDYAVSGDWPPPPPEEEDCSATLLPRVDADVSDFDNLLVAATTGDWAYAEVIALQVDPCVSMNDAGQRDAIIDYVIESGVINWAAGPQAWQYMDGEDFTRGSSQFLTLMDYAKMAIEESVLDGWTPTTPEDAERIARLDDLHTTLTAGPRSDAQSYWLATLHINAAECSEDAAILLDPTSNHIVIVHRNPGC